MKKAGFSLIELTIVLVIIGLLIGGILVGKSMVDDAHDQSIVSDWQKYSAAANSYFSKYGYWPGDDADAYYNAGTNPNGRWDTAAGGGNGDGTLGASNADLEFMYFWQDLSLSGFLTGTYSGAFDANGAPKTQISNSWMTHYYDGTTNQQFYLTGNSPAAPYSKVGYTGEAGIAYVLSGFSAGSIDLKIDDGTPNTGTVIATGGVTPCVYGTSPATTCNLYYIYKK